MSVFRGSSQWKCARHTLGEGLSSPVAILGKQGLEGGVVRKYWGGFTPCFPSSIACLRF